uniref:DUF4365 domain-containing protein n=1 Tax=mine drainage metagenome TaxID=410659 RepID=E6PWM9_9ZZZZ
MSTTSATQTLSSTQKGVIGENLLVNAVMKASKGQLSPFKPVADDDGIDVLFFNKETGTSVAIQLKCRTNTDGGGNTTQFDIRKATYNEERQAFVVAALLNENMHGFDCLWFIPMKEVKRIGNKKTDKYVLTPSKIEGSADKYREFRCENHDELAKRIIGECK